MSIKYNGKLIAGKYKTQIIPSADTVNEGKIKIATQLEVDEGTSNNSAVTPLYLSKKQDKLTAGTGIEITEDNVINNTQTSAEWGNIQGNILDQPDLISELGKKQDVITDIDTIRSNAENAANNSLSNLSEAGQAIVDYKANIDLNNLSETGEARFNGKANVNLDNLSEAGEKHFLNKQQITNCLTEVPQRIKLELNDGTLILKAGSQVIVPNGFEADGTTPKFDYVTIESDTKVAETGGSVQTMISIVGTSPQATNIKNCISGSNPTITKYSLVYDTTNNTVTRYSSDTTAGVKSSLPIAICTQTDKVTTSIDQVFNGMGYIGSIIWVDKGVKGLSPNGRNEDGSLKNVEITTNKITLKDYNSHTLNEHRTLLFTSNFKFMDTLSFTSGSLANRPVTVSSTKTFVYYCEDENIMYHTSGSTTANWTVSKAMPVGNFNVTSKGEITSFNPKQPFKALDYNDKSNISGWSLPSTKYIDLTLGENGSTYTATANGWFQIDKITGISGFAYLVLRNNTSGICNNSSAYNFSSGTLSAFVPAIKGDTISVSYNATGNTTLFRFIYAQGEV